MHGLTEYFGSFITGHKKQRISEVLQYRTRFITAVVEDVYQPHNANAVIRTCDILGIQDLHIIENRNVFKISAEVALGAQKWVTRIRYNTPGIDNTKQCCVALKKAGYRIAAAGLDSKAIPLDEFDITENAAPTAVMFGTEETGLSDSALSLADCIIKIPMFGFTQSFNISVSAALILDRLIRKVHKSEILWNLSENEKDALRSEWYRTVLGKRADAIERRFFQGKREL